MSIKQLIMKLFAYTIGVALSLGICAAPLCAQRTEATEPDATEKIQINIETPDGYKPVTLTQMEEFLLDFLFSNHRGTLPAVLDWQIVSTEYQNTSLYGLEAKWSNGNYTITKISKTAKGQWVLEAMAMTGMCYFKRYAPSNAQCMEEGVCRAILWEDAFKCKNAEHCGECGKTTSAAGGELYLKKPFR
jgi:hypothetical protein